MRNVEAGAGKQRFAHLVLLGLIAGLAACGSERDGAEEATRAPESRAGAAEVPAQPTSGYTPIEVADGGTVRGTIRFTGDAPPAREVPVTVDRDVCGESRRVQAVVTGTGGTLADAVVSLTDIRRGAAFTPDTPPTLDQRGCRFRPHVVVVPTGAALRVLNGDPLTHNVHTVAFDNRPVNRTQPADLESLELRFEAPEKVRVKCDLHPWMSAWIVVAEHPYHAVTDSTGRFELTDVPPGTYTLEVWHESLGTRTRSVTLTAGEDVELTIEIDGAPGD